MNLFSRSPGACEQQSYDLTGSQAGVRLSTVLNSVSSLTTTISFVCPLLIPSLSQLGRNEEHGA